MSRTYRKPSKNRGLGLSKLKKVKDGTRTKTANSCRNNRECPYCESNRLHKHKKQISLEEEIVLSCSEYKLNPIN